MKFVQAHIASVLLVAFAFAVVLASTVSFGQFASAETNGPTVALATVSASTTNAASIPITATFSEAVSGFGTSSISATNGTIVGFSGSGSTYSFSLNPTADGTTTVQINANVATSVASSTGNQASNVLTFLSDRTSPTIVEVSGIASTTVTATPSFSFSSNEAGTIQLSGGCTSATTTAVTGTTTLMFNALSNGSHSCTLSVTDAAGNVSNTLNINFTVAVPAALTVADVVASSIGTSTATITWTTNAAASSQVFFGTSAAYGSSSVLDSTASTSHSVTLTNLTEATLYHYRVESVNANGTATSSDHTFVTSSTASSTPLAVTGIDSVSVTATADGTFEHGFKWILHFVVPSNETVFRMKFADFTTPTSSGTIPVANNVRYSSPQSSNASTTASAIIESNNEYGAALQLTGDTSTTTAGRQIDVAVETAVPVGTPTGVYSTLFGALSTTTP